MEKLNVAFAAINPYLEDNIIENVQKEIKGQEMIQYGDKNIYPNYLYGLYESVSTLKSIINGISGSFHNIAINKSEYAESINEKGETIEDIIKQIIIDYCLYGGFALNIVRNRIGGIAGIYNLDFKCVRSNKKNTEFYYSEFWADKSYGRVKYTTYPAFDPNDSKQATSIFYYNCDKYRTYPSPVWGGAVKSAECLSHISDFHLNSLYNGLSSDYIINLNAGTPTPEAQEEIEDSFSEKFTGWQNGGRQILSFNPDFQHRTTIEAIPQSDFVDRYNALEKGCKQDIYCAFSVSPVLFGLPAEGLGFSDQDIQESFKLAKALVFEPILKMVKRSFEKIFGEKEVITIEMIDIDWTKDEDSELVK